MGESVYKGKSVSVGLCVERLCGRVYVYVREIVCGIECMCI